IKQVSINKNNSSLSDTQLTNHTIYNHYQTLLAEQIINSPYSLAPYIFFLVSDGHFQVLEVCCAVIFGFY
ncbi:hypothetical protein ACCD08_32075, partial [Telluria sp. Tellsp104]